MAQMQRIEALRGFRHRRETQAPGSVLDLELPLAIELRTANKVKFVHQQTPLTHKTELPDPNRLQAERQASRAAAQQPPAAAPLKTK